MKKIIYNIILVGLSALLLTQFNACKSQLNETASANRCKPTSITSPLALNGLPEAIEIEYDASLDKIERINYLHAGKVDTIISTPATVVFKSGSNVKTYYLNSQQLADSAVAVVFSPSPSFVVRRIEFTEKFIYDVDKRIISSTIFERQFNNNNTVTFDTLRTNVVYNNGNATQVTFKNKNSNTTTNYNYGTDKTYNFGYVSADINSLNFSFLGKRSVNLPTSAQTTGTENSSTTFQYQLETNGNVKKQTITKTIGSNTKIQNKEISYQCK